MSKCLPLIIWRGRDLNPHRLTATFGKRASLLPVGKWELPPSWTTNSFQCFCNLLPVCHFWGTSQCNFLPYSSKPSRPFGNRYFNFSTVPYLLGNLPLRFSLFTVDEISLVLPLKSLPIYFSHYHLFHTPSNNHGVHSPLLTLHPFPEVLREY